MQRSQKTKSGKNRRLFPERTTNIKNKVLKKSDN